jgi:hypothetical protein
MAEAVSKNPEEDSFAEGSILESRKSGLEVRGFHY